MIYGLFQYYNEELSSWNRTVEFRKEESRDLLRRISILQNQQVITSAQGKESESFIDQFMVQEQKLDHIANQIASQQQRLEHGGSYPDKPVENPISQQQDLLRTRLHNTERNFIRIKYTCSIFLSSFLNG